MNEKEIEKKEPEVKKRQFVQTPEVRVQNRYVSGARKEAAETVSAIGTPKQVEALNVGDLVQHRKFGLGTVLEVNSVNADYQVKVNFVKVGEKTLFAKLAGLKKVSEG